MIPENVDKLIREEWFQNHKAVDTKTLEKDSTIEWKRPDSRNYQMTYIIRPGRLIVTGDVGDAIYSSGFSSFADWASCDIGYFASKCVASENGAQYKEWDPEYLEPGIREALKENGKSWTEFQRMGGTGAMTYKQEWIVWLVENGAHFFGEDRMYWPTDGERISVRCRGHLIGLKMAVEQLKEK